MKTQDEIMSCLSTLRDYLEEAHQDDHQSEHFGDDPSTCSYCRAIHEAEGILALNSGPSKPITGPSSEAWLVFGKVNHEIVSVDLAHGAEEMAQKCYALKPNVEMVPLDLARRAPSLESALRDLFNAFHVPDDGLELDAEAAYDVAADVLGASIPINPETFNEAAEVVGAHMAERMLGGKP